jgi:hypothetical protein
MRAITRGKVKNTAYRTFMPTIQATIGSHAQHPLEPGAPIGIAVIEARDDGDGEDGCYQSLAGSGLASLSASRVSPTLSDPAPALVTSTSASPSST